MLVNVPQKNFKKRAIISIAALLFFLKRHDIYRILKLIRSFFSKQHYQYLYHTPPRHVDYPDFFLNDKGLLIHYKIREATVPKIRGIIVFIHGWAEHSGRYLQVFSDLNEAGYHVASLDLQGHGRSDGDRGHVADVKDLVDDVKKLCDIIDEKYCSSSDKLVPPRIIFGHSFGGLISVLTVLEKPRYFAAMSLSGPCFEPAGVKGLHWLTWIVSCFFCKLPIAKIDLKVLSHNPNNAWRASNDPLHYKGSINAHTLSQMCYYGYEALRMANRVKIPIFLFGGKDDVVVNNLVWEKFLDRTSTVMQEKEIILIDQLYHEVLFEKETHEQQIEDLWENLLRFFKIYVNQRMNTVSLIKKRSSQHLLALSAQGGLLS